MENTTLCLTDTWLDDTQPWVSTTTTGHTFELNTPTITYPDWTAPFTTSNYVTYWPDYSYRTYGKIQLKLSEVMYLRKCASEDKKLRKVLKKLAPYIEITVDFPGGV